MGHIKDFIDNNYLHFNAASLKNASKSYVDIMNSGGKMLVSMAGAMSTAELGISLAEMIRQGKVHALSVTGANLEEDLMHLIAYKSYEDVPNYRDLTPEDEAKLLKKGLNRVTDVCIPEHEAFRKLEKALLEEWQELKDKKERKFPHEVLYSIIKKGDLDKEYEKDKKNSWLVAACDKNLPIFVPGWEDSTTGNIFAAYCITNEFSPSIIKSGIEYMVYLSEWYIQTSKNHAIGFFQIGGGISGDFPICVVPMMRQDLEMEEIPLWAYFCQISDSTTSFGSYSGAVPNEKITWEKLDIHTPKFIIESDATIVAPLMFNYILES